MNLFDILDWMKSPQRSQQLQGLGGLLSSNLSNLQEKANTANAVLERALPNPANLGQVGDREAYKQAADMAFNALSVAPVGMTVFHGSPYKFTNFDPTKIGTGEGAQAYGYGHYVAESPEVAKEYRTALSEPELFKNGRQIKTTAGSNMDTAKAWLQDSFESGAPNPFEDAITKVAAAPIKEKEGVISALQKLQSRGVQMQKGGFEYEIDLPDEQIAKMLDWDKPLSEQPFRIQSSVFNEMTDAGYSKNEINHLLNNKSGMELYKKIYKDMEQGVPEAINMAKRMNLGESGMMMDAPALASESLRRMGIPGIRYLDQGSRGAGQGTSNFVVFPGNEGLLKIEKINEKPIDELRKLGLLD